MPALALGTGYRTARRGRSSDAPRDGASPANRPGATLSWPGSREGDGTLGGPLAPPPPRASWWGQSQRHSTVLTATRPSSARTTFPRGLRAGGEVPMPSRSRSHPVVTITGVVYALLGLALAGGGVWLAALGGSPFYVIAGLGHPGHRRLAGRAGGGRRLWVYAAVLIGTLVWAVSRSRLRLVAARGARRRHLPAGPLAADPWITRNLGPRHGAAGWSTTLPLWVGVVAGAVVLAIGLSPTTTRSTARSRRPRPAAAAGCGGQPAEDWRAYGRTQSGQRYSPLTQITPANVKNLKVAWTFRTGDLPGTERPGRDDLRGHADQGRRHALPLLAASAPVRARRRRPASCAGPTIRRCRTTRPSST